MPLTSALPFYPLPQGDGTSLYIGVFPSNRLLGNTNFGNFPAISATFGFWKIAVNAFNIH